jgi:cytochrome c peroxidase
MPLSDDPKIIRHHWFNLMGVASVVVLILSATNPLISAQSGSQLATNEGTTVSADGSVSLTAERHAERGRRLFTTETFGGNGRTCRTCHSAETGTVSPQDAKERLKKDYRDPLFVFDGSDDGQGNGMSRMLQEATVLVNIPLPPTVRLADDPDARFVFLTRGIPSTLNTPALDPVLMLDGRDPDLPTQALHAIQRHAQVSTAIPHLDLLRIAEFEKTEQFYSSPRLRRYAQGGPAPRLPEGRTISEIRGKRFFIDAPATGDLKTGACALCHSGPMLNQTNQFLPLPVPPGTRFQTVNVSERDVRNRKRPFIFKNADGTETMVWTPDPGRALITGVIDGDPNANGAPFFTSLNSFKIPTLWGVKTTAPYFHDNSAMTLEDVVDHYGDFVFNKLPPPFTFTLTPQDRTDIVAYLKLLD